jgi:hypothetical protein
MGAMGQYETLALQEPFPGEDILSRFGVGDPEV